MTTLTSTYQFRGTSSYSTSWDPWLVWGWQDFTLKTLSIYAVPPAGGGYIGLKLLKGTNWRSPTTTVDTELKEIPSGGGYVDFDCNFDVPAEWTMGVRVVLPQGGTVYCSTIGQSYPFGANGANNAIVNTNTFNMDVTFSYPPNWCIDDQNEGYPWPIGSDPIDFTGFPKDGAGYPYNCGVWKMDGQNDGYLWICGFDKRISNNFELYKVYDSELNEYNVYDSELNEYKVYLKT